MWTWRNLRNNPTHDFLSSPHTRQRSAHDIARRLRKKEIFDCLQLRLSFFSLYHRLEMIWMKKFLPDNPKVQNIFHSPLGVTRLWCADVEGACGACSWGGSSMKLVEQILSLEANVPTEWRRWCDPPLIDVVELCDKLKNLWSLYFKKWNICNVSKISEWQTIKLIPRSSVKDIICFVILRLVVRFESRGKIYCVCGRRQRCIPARLNLIFIILNLLNEILLNSFLPPPLNYLWVVNGSAVAPRSPQVSQTAATLACISTVDVVVEADRWRLGCLIGARRSFTERKNSAAAAALSWRWDALDLKIIRIVWNKRIFSFFRHSSRACLTNVWLLFLLAARV